MIVGDLCRKFFIASRLMFVLARAGFSMIFVFSYAEVKQINRFAKVNIGINFLVIPS